MNIATDHISTSSPTAPVFDYDAALARLDGDVELFGMLAGLYQLDSAQLFEQLCKGAARGDLQIVQRAAHSLKGLAANFDAHQAVQSAASIEASARAMNLTAAAAAIPELQIRLESLRQALASYVHEPIL